jgi:hypothetical protein
MADLPSLVLDRDLVALWPRVAHPLQIVGFTVWQGTVVELLGLAGFAVREGSPALAGDLLDLVELAEVRAAGALRIEQEFAAMEAGWGVSPWCRAA